VVLDWFLLFYMLFASFRESEECVFVLWFVSGERERERERERELKLDCFILFGDGFVGSRIGMGKNGEEE
jgi:hypothetical protein